MIRVLICDDAVAFATLVGHWLSACDDIEVVGTASSGAQALEMIGSLAPDVVLLDYLLYDVPEGPQHLVPKLRENRPRTAIVLVSSMPADRLAAVAAQCDVDHFLSKAAAEEDFCEAIREAAVASGRAPGDPPQLATA